ncbi:MAG: hypothetical protein M3Q38_00845 [Chloroflexota bacterium]|nr:hypothetical protein [Chloroflexota bacterium]
MSRPRPLLAALVLVLVALGGGWWASRDSRRPEWVASRDGRAIDHDGIYVGLDGVRDARFVSSRRTADGPTIGDAGGASVLVGSGYRAEAFRAIRRP